MRLSKIEKKRNLFYPFLYKWIVFKINWSQPVSLQINCLILLKELKRSCFLRFFSSLIMYWTKYCANLTGNVRLAKFSIVLFVISFVYCHDVFITEWALHMANIYSFSCRLDLHRLMTFLVLLGGLYIELLCLLKVFHIFAIKNNILFARICSWQWCFYFRFWTVQVKDEVLWNLRINCIKTRNEKNIYYFTVNHFIYRFNVNSIFWKMKVK